MTELLLDVRAGATAGGILGALVEVGASLEAVERAVGRLGSGSVRMSVRGGATGTAIRVFAPEGTTVASSWGALRPRVAMLALEDGTLERVVTVLDRLFAARAMVHRVPAPEVEQDPVGGPDELALAVAVAAALESLAPRTVGVGPVGVAGGVLDTLEGEVRLPGPVVLAALGDHPRLTVAEGVELVDPLGAAWVHELAGAGERVTAEALDDRGPQGPTGRGRLPTTDSVRVTLLASRAVLR